MTNGIPMKICIWCPECGFNTIHEFVYEKDPYLAYECTRCGRIILVPKGSVYKFTDLSNCV